MKLNIHKNYSGDLNFPKQNFKNSIFKFSENNEAFIVAEDLSCTDEEIDEFVKFAVLPQNEIEAAADEAPLDRIYSLRFRAKVLCAIARFNSTFIAYRQLSEFLSMNDNKFVSDYALKASLEKLRKTGFIEVCKVKAKGASNDLIALYKLSNFHLKDGSLLKILGSRIESEDLEDLHPISGLSLKAEKVLRSNILSSIIVEMFKAGFITDAYLPGNIEDRSDSFSIKSYVSVKAPGDTDKKLFLFAPRSAPGFEEKLKTSIKSFADEHKGDQTLPKLLLCCEDADMIFDINELLEDFNDSVQLIFTDDLSIANDFGNAFSLFDENGTEIQLAPLSEKPKPAQSKKQAPKKGNTNQSAPSNKGSGNRRQSAPKDSRPKNG